MNRCPKCHKELMEPVEHKYDEGVWLFVHKELGECCDYVAVNAENSVEAIEALENWYLTSQCKCDTLNKT